MTQGFENIALPEPIFYPPFNITRISHVALTVRDLDASLKFWCGVLGLMVSDQNKDTAWLHGPEESSHHSIILTQSNGQPSCDVIGFRVLTEHELDRAYEWATTQDLSPEWIDTPYQSRTLRLRDASGMPIELCAHMPVVKRHLDHTTAGLCVAKRLDHVQILDPNINANMAFYVSLGFRISDAIIVDGSVGACFLWRKGSVSDLVLMESDGPRVHHIAFFVRKPDDILRVCDLIGEKGFPATTTEEGPGRHGMDGSYYVYLRDPDGHRVELFDGHYQTIDAELEPKQCPPEIASPPWGLPTLESWFKEGTPFTDTAIQDSVRPSAARRGAPTMEAYVRAKDKG